MVRGGVSFGSICISWFVSAAEVWIVYDVNDCILAPISCYYAFALFWQEFSRIVSDTSIVFFEESSDWVFRYIEVSRMGKSMSYTIYWTQCYVIFLCAYTVYRTMKKKGLRMRLPFSSALPLILEGDVYKDICEKYLQICQLVTYLPCHVCYGVQQISTSSWLRKKLMETFNDLMSMI